MQTNKEDLLNSLVSVQNTPYTQFLQENSQKDLLNNLRKKQNLVAAARRFKIIKNPLIQETYKVQNKLKRSVTTEMPKKNLRAQLVQENKGQNLHESHLQASSIDPIVFQLRFKQKPKVIKYNVKRLKSNTLLYKTDKGLLHCSFDPSFECSRRFKGTGNKESSDQLILGTENTLFDFYNQSIRLQNLIRKKEMEKKLDSAAFSGLSHKLANINQSIVNEQTRISRSFFMM